MFEQTAFSNNVKVKAEKLVLEFSINRFEKKIIQNVSEMRM